MTKKRMVKYFFSDVSISYVSLFPVSFEINSFLFGNYSNP